MNSPWKEFALVGIGALMCFLFMRSCNKSVEMITPVTNDSLYTVLTSKDSIIGVLRIYIDESDVREKNYTEKIKEYERINKALSTRTFTDLQRDEWIKSYRTKHD